MGPESSSPGNGRLNRDQRSVLHEIVAHQTAMNKTKNKYIRIGEIACLLILAAYLNLHTLLASARAEQTGPTESSIYLTPDERQWLAQHDGQIRIGITVIPPQVIRDDGKYQGLSIDYIRLMERKLGCRFKVVPFATWNEVIQAAKTHRIDMIFAAQQTPERLKYLRFTAPYIELPNMILVRKERRGGASLKEMKGWSVATSEGSAVHEYLKSEHGYLDLRPVQDELSGLMKVSLGEVDAMVVEISRASYYIEKAGIVNLRVAGEAGLVYQLRFAARNDWPKLITILDKGLAMITPEERREINRRWIILGERSVFASRAFRISLATVLGLITLAFAGGIVWNRTLRRTVRQRTLELQRELAERKRAEEALHKLNRELRAISNCNQVLIRAEDEQALLNNICRIICDEAGYRMAWVGYAEHDDAKTIRPVARAGLDNGYVEQVRLTWADTERGRGPGGRAIRCGESFSQDFVTDSKTSPWRESALQRGYRTGIALPLKDENANAFGVLSIYSTEPNAFTPEERQLLGELADDLAFGITVLRTRIERKQVEEQLQANLRFFESMNRVNQAIQGTNDIEQMMSDVLDTVLSIFGCDRAFLAVPCDPDVPEFNVSMERTSPAYPGAFEKDVAVPMSPAVKQLFRELLNNQDPNEIYIGKGLDPEDEVWKTYEVKSQLAIALYPKVGKPWEYGLHQCSHARVWTPTEKKLFLEISRRLADGLTGLLSHRDLKESEAKYRRIIDTANEGIWMLGADLLTTFENARMVEMIGYTGAEMIGRPVTDFMFDEDAPDHRRRMENRRRGVSEHYELRFRHKNGEAVWTQVSAVSIMDDRQGFEGTFAMLTDITERKRAEDALKQNETELATIYDNAPLMMLLVDKDRRVIKANRAVVQDAGRKMEDIVGLCGGDIFNCLHTLDDPNGCGFGPYCSSCGLRDAIATTLNTGQSIYRKEASLLIDRGVPLQLHVLVSTVLLEVHGQSAVLVCIEDITERIKLEEQLLQAQKMEAIGTLAGGIAHDFNNILTAIIGYGSLLRVRLNQDSSAKNYLDDILAASERAANLTKSLLAFSRKQVMISTPVDLNEIVKRFNKFIMRVIGEDIEVRVLLTKEDLTVMADSGQIEQVLMNLATNARDAMPGGGILTVKTERVSVGAEIAGSTITPGKYAAISVSDTGTGMSEETRQRIFEPFYTTKELGKGTGLGMSIVYGIIKQHGGEIVINSEIGAGTTLRIYLRLIDANAERVSVVQSAATARGSETVLVAEDDDQIRRLIKTILVEHGYTVIEAMNGEDAVAKFTANQDRLQLLLLDMLMPKKSGRDAYEEIRKMKGNIRAIFLSGYAMDIVQGKSILEEGLTFLSKPVTPQLLLSKVREVLDK